MIFSKRLAQSLALLLFLFWIGGSTLHAAEALIIADARTGYILEAQAQQKKRQIGSLTKIAMAMVVLDWASKRGGDLNQTATIPPEAFVNTGANNIGFQSGDQITLRDLLYAALIQSDNIAAYALADHVGRELTSSVPVPDAGRVTSVTSFVAQMNALAKALQMERTRFLNPHGIDQVERPYSTAADMARLSRYAMNNAGFRFYVSQKERKISYQRAGKTLSYLLRNTNELLGTNGIDGVKTGRTARAGDCLILSAHRDPDVVQDGQATKVYPRRIIVVLLGSTDRFGEGTQLIGRGWQLYDQWVAAGRPSDPKRSL